MFDQYKNIEDRPVFLFQPEAFLILERLERDPHVLEDIWIRRYPREELERLSIAWGTAPGLNLLQKFPTRLE